MGCLIWNLFYVVVIRREIFSWVLVLTYAWRVDLSGFRNEDRYIYVKICAWISCLNCIMLGLYSEVELVLLINRDMSHLKVIE